MAGDNSNTKRRADRNSVRGGLQARSPRRIEHAASEAARAVSRVDGLLDQVGSFVVRIAGSVQPPPNQKPTSPQPPPSETDSLLTAIAELHARLDSFDHIAARLDEI